MKFNCVVLIDVVLWMKVLDVFFSYNFVWFWLGLVVVLGFIVFSDKNLLILEGFVDEENYFEIIFLEVFFEEYFFGDFMFVK